MIIAENVEGTALSMLVHNHVNGIFQCVAVRAPGFGDRRLHKLEDIAALTGGAVYSKHSGFSLETMTTEHLGRARQVRVTADNTAIIGGGGSSEAVDFRLGQMRAELERATFGIDEDVLTERIGALSGKVAVIRVGAPTSAELKELRHRVEDALSATGRRWPRASWPAAAPRCCTRSALRWTALAARRRGRDRGLRDRRGDRAPGAVRARHADRRQRRLPGRGRGRGQRPRSARTKGSTRCHGRHGNMIEMGIVDPLRVVRSALQNGASVAGLLLTTNTLVAEEQTPWGGSRALMTEYGSLDEGLHQPSPDSSTPQSLGLGPSVG